MIEIRWHGRGGQGAWSAARLLGSAAALYSGKFAMAFPSFGPERRGAPVLGFTRIDDERILDRSNVVECDYVVVLDETLIDAKTAIGLKPKGFAVVNTKDASRYAAVFGGRVIGIDATEMALVGLGKAITNTCMLGALAGASGIVSEEALVKAVRTEMKGDTAEKNVALVSCAYAAGKAAKGGSR